jgi:hypothetical protein
LQRVCSSTADAAQLAVLLVSHAALLLAWLLSFLRADNSRRAFYKEFRRVVEASDVVIQVRQATAGHVLRMCTAVRMLLCLQSI